MDPNNGNIYTPAQAAALGIDFKSLMPMDDDEAVKEMRKRSAKAKALMKKKRKAAKASRKRNR